MKSKSIQLCNMFSLHTNLHDQFNKEKKNKTIEYKYVALSHTIINPRAMMIIYLNTSLTNVTVFRSLRSN